MTHSKIVDALDVSQHEITPHERAVLKSLDIALQEIQRLRHDLTEREQETQTEPGEPVAPATCETWTSTAEKLPPSGKLVLVYYVNLLGNGHIITARWQAEGTVEMDDSCEEEDVNVEGTNTVSGWFDECEHETSLRIADVVTHWMAVPKRPSAHQPVAQKET